MFRWLATAVAMLVAIGVVGIFLPWFGHDRVFGLLVKIRLNGEQNLPTYFSAMQLALASSILFLIALRRRAERARDARPWLVLAIGFALMSMDEIVSLHEMLVNVSRRAFGIEGVSLFHFAWVIPALFLVAVLGLYFIGFLRRLPARTRRLFILSGAMFVGGAVGLEMLGGLYHSTHPALPKLGTDSRFAYDIFTVVEEGLELLGVTVFVFALLDYCARYLGEVRFQFGQSPAKEDAAPAE